MSGEPECPQCPHTRMQHSKDGCTACPCKVTYMDLSPRKK